MCLAAFDVTIGMVLVQKDELSDDVIYYLSRNVRKTEIKYAHVDKLALVVVQAIQMFRYHILCLKTTMLLDYSPMVYILTRQFLGENIING